MLSRTESVAAQRADALVRLLLNKSGPTTIVAK